MPYPILQNDNLVVPSQESIDAFLYCRENTTLGNIRQLCINCGIEIHDSELSSLYESFFLFEANDSKLNNLFAQIRSPEYTLDSVLSAVTALNSIYHTRLDDSYSTGRNIYNNFDSIREHLYNSPYEAIEIIANINRNGNNTQDHTLSFASKFCNFLAPNSYPIFDKYASNLIYWYLNSKRNSGVNVEHYYKKHLGIPIYYQLAYDEFSRLYELDTERYPYRKIDIFLWMYAKMLDISNRKNFEGILYIPADKRTRLRSYPCPCLQETPQ